MTEKSTPSEGRIAELPPSRLSTDQSGPVMIAGQYRVDEMLGGGGMGTVYKCTDLALNRTVALKLLHPHLVATNKWFLRFQQEAKAVARLEHPNIIRMHHFSPSDDTPFIVMDFICGSSLSDIISANGKLSLERTLKIMIQVADALAHAHANGVVHRDLKPSNIMVLDGTVDEIKILDFGIAQLSDDQCAIDPVKLTQTGEVFGSPAYMSPEQCEGKKIDARSDQYSLGCVLFECLTGTPPFSAASPIHVMMQQITDAPPTLKEATLGQPFAVHLENTTRKLLSKQPEDRFTDMEEVVRILRGQPISEQANALDCKPIQLSTVAGSNLKTLSLINQEGSLRDPKQQHRTHLFIGAAVLVALSISMAAIWSIISMPSEPTKTVSLASLPNSVDTIINNSMSPVLEMEEKFSIADFAKIEKLGQLEVLNLTKSDVPNEGMYSLAKLTKLRSLILDRCTGFNGTGLARIENLPNLIQLSATHTGLKDEDLEHLNTNLEYLNLGNCAITNRGVQNLLRLKKLSVLKLGHSGITDGVEKILAEMKTLEELDLTNISKRSLSLEALKRLTKALPNCAIRCTGLQPGEAVYASTQNADQQQLERMSQPSLRTVIFNNCQNIDGRGLAKLENMKTLFSLSASNSSITDSDLAHLNPRLKTLRLESCRLTDAGVAHLGRLKELRRLYLNDNNISDESLKVLCQLKKLQVLELRRNPLLTQKANVLLLKELPHCVIVTNAFPLRLSADQ